jgi:hypothetical protein
MIGHERMAELMQAERDQEPGQHKRKHQYPGVVGAVQHPHRAGEEYDDQQQKRGAERR